MRQLTTDVERTAAVGTDDFADLLAGRHTFRLP